MTMRRLFIAVDLAIPVVERLALLQDEVQSRLEEKWEERVRLRRTQAPNIHITLKFIGDTAPELVPMIHALLEKLCEPLFPFEVECLGVGVFPEPRRPRILWAGLDEKSAEVLGLLQTALERDLHKLGLDKESRPYRPHVTLARVKSRSAPSFEELIADYSDVSFGKSYIKDLILYESHLDSTGPRYEVVHRYPLGSA